MGARQKLNGAYFLGSVVLAGLIGWFTGSWLILVLSSVVLLGIRFNNGEIRLGKRRDR